MMMVGAMMTSKTTTESKEVRPSRNEVGVLRSARTRLVAAVLVLLAFSTVASVLALRELLIAQLGERVDDSLDPEVREFRRLADVGRDPRTGEPFGDDVAAMFEVFLARNVPFEGESYFTFVGEQPFRSSGEEVSADVLTRIRELGRTETTVREEIETGDARVRILAVPVELGGEVRGTFAAAVDLAGEREEVDEAVRLAAGVGIAVFLLGSLLAIAISGRVLAPVRELTETARTITETDLTRRIEVRGSDELAELARTFNEMLDRLEEAFAAQRRFLSDAGHELRTPITIIRGHLEVMGDHPEERRETLELVTDELDRMGRLVDEGIISRFRTLPVAPSSVLSGQALSSTLSNLFSCFLVVMVALLVGFRPTADPAAWLLFCGLLVLFTLATTWLAMFFGLVAKTPEGAGAFSYILLLLIFISPSFVPTDSMPPLLRGFAENQPMTPIVETMRSLLTEGTPGSDLWLALAWSAGILVVSYTLALGVYRRSAPIQAAQ
jgi:signal transduction histidine kinase